MLLSCVFPLDGDVSFQRGHDATDKIQQRGDPKLHHGDRQTLHPGATGMEGSPGTAASLAPSLPCLYSVSVSSETNWRVWCLSVSLSLQLGDLINLLLNDEVRTVELG